MKRGVKSPLATTNRTALAAVLTVIASKIQLAALDSSLGVGSSMSTQRALQRWRRAPTWESVVTVLKNHPSTAHLDFERLSQLSTV